MSNQSLAVREEQSTMIEQVLISGDLKALTPAQRLDYYHKVCNSLGLNPLTKPFDYITLNGKLVLYAKRDCTDQLRKSHNVSVTITDRTRLEDVYVVTARATTPTGRSDESTGAVAVGSLKGEALANALMKAETKAKRRVTLSIVGLGWLDETEVETIPGARPEPATNGHTDPPAASELTWEAAVALASDAGMSEVALKALLKAAGLGGYKPARDSALVRELVADFQPVTA